MNRWEPTVTARQLRILRFIRAYVISNGYPPSVREIGQECGLSSTSSVHHHLRRLADKGFVRQAPGRSRAISVRLPGEAS